MRYSEVDSIYKIDIISFLRNYVGINVGGSKCNRLTHDDIKELDLVRIPYTEAYDNPKLVCSGEYLIVYDANKEIIVYKNPLVIDDVLQEEKYDYEEVIETIELPDLRGLSKDELLALRRKVRKIGEYRKAGEITKQIRKVKRREPKRYREEKAELRYLDRIIEEENYEKIKRRWVFK